MTRDEARRIAEVIRTNTRPEAARILGCCGRTVVRLSAELAKAHYDVGEPRKGGRHTGTIPPNDEETP